MYEKLQDKTFKRNLAGKNNNFLDLLTYHYLQRTNKVLAAKFKNKVRIPMSKSISEELPTLQDVVVHFYETYQPENYFLHLLIYKYLQGFNTTLAEKFRKKVKLPMYELAVDFPTLQDIVTHFYESTRQEIVHTNINDHEKGPSRARKKIVNSVTSANMDKLVPLNSQRRGGRLVKGKFSDHELRVLHESILKYGDNINYCKLAKELGRQRSVVWIKINNLKTGIGRVGKHSLYTLEEDYFIIDSVLSGATDVTTVRELVLSQKTCRLVADQLRRSFRSVHDRWDITLKRWILSYYCGAINLDIDSVLIKYLTSIYKYHDPVDWNVVIKRPEFAGHTTRSLQQRLQNLIGKTSRVLGIDRSQLTFPNIAELVNDKPTVTCISLSDKKINYQHNIISYFEQSVKTHNINIVQVQV